MISIVIPVYNAGEYLEECLNSIRNQTYQDYEVICVDDGSTDISGEICKAFANQDTRIKYLRQDNAGVSAARNLGLKNATGEYVCFVDSDDVLAENYLLRLLDLSKDGSFSICSHTCDIKYLDRESDKIIRYAAKDYIERIVTETINHPNLWEMLFKSSIIKEFNIEYTIGCVKNEDTEFYIKYMIHENNVVVSNYIGYYYRLNPTSVMAAQITKKSLTSIEASRRINDFLKKEEIINDDIVLSNGVLVYVYVLAKKQNKDLYDYLHDHYNVKAAMKKMITFPRTGKRAVALLYLILGRKTFYRMAGLEVFRRFVSYLRKK